MLHTHIYLFTFSYPIQPKFTAGRWAFPQDFNTRLLFSSPTNVGHHNPPPFRTQCPRSLKTLTRVCCFPPQLMWDITIHPPSGPIPFRTQCSRWHSFLSRIDVGPPPNLPLGAQHSYWHTASCLPPFRGTVRRLAHRPVSNSDTICNDPRPPLVGLPLKALKRVY